MDPENEAKSEKHCSLQGESSFSNKKGEIEQGDLLRTVGNADLRVRK